MVTVKDINEAYKQVQLKEELAKDLAYFGLEEGRITRVLDEIDQVFPRIKEQLDLSCYLIPSSIQVFECYIGSPLTNPPNGGRMINTISGFISVMCQDTPYKLCASRVKEGTTLVIAVKQTG